MLTFYGLTQDQITALYAWWEAFGDGEVPEPTPERPFDDVRFLRRHWRRQYGAPPQKIRAAA